MGDSRALRGRRGEGGEAGGGRRAGIPAEDESPFSDSARSWAVSYRSSGRFSRQRSTMTSSAGGAPVGGGPEWLWIVVEDCGESVRRRRAGNRTPCREHLVEDAAERENVGAAVHVPAADLLGRHVAQRADAPSPDSVAARSGDVSVVAMPETGSSLRARARSRGSSAARPDVTSTFSGLRSRWTMPAAWAACEAVGDLRRRTSTAFRTRDRALRSSGCGASPLRAAP